MTLTVGSNTSKYYLIKNMQGDVIALADETGAICRRYTYDAWGKITSVTTAAGVTVSEISSADPAIANHFRYRSYFYDDFTRLYQLETRYYDPNTGRFVNADGYVNTGNGILGTNMFTYCHNNPIMHMDQTGKVETVLAYTWMSMSIDPADIFLGNVSNGNSFFLNGSDTYDLMTNTAEISIESTFATARHIYKTTERPKNIGAGPYNKYVTQKLAQLDRYSVISGKVFNALAYTGVAIDAAEGAYANINSGKSTGKIIWDATVDVAVSGTNVWAAAAVGGAAGSAICPIVGTIAGALFGGVLYYIDPKEYLKSLF